MKINNVCSMLLTFGICAYSAASAADTTTDAYIMKLYNNTEQAQLHYTVKPLSKNQKSGNLAQGDDHGVAIGVANGDEMTEIIISDNDGQIILDCKVNYYFGGKEFYTNTVVLSPQYHVATNVFSNIHMITFDISQS